VRGSFADGEVAAFVAKACEAALQVQRERVVDLGTDLTVGEVLAELVAAGSADDVLVEDMSSVRGGEGKHDAFFHS